MEGGVMRAERRAGWMEEGGGSLEGECRHAWPIGSRRWKTPSTLLTSSFVPHSHPSHPPHLCLSDIQNTLSLNTEREGFLKPVMYDSFREDSLSVLALLCHIFILYYYTLHLSLLLMSSAYKIGLIEMYFCLRLCWWGNIYQLL